VETTEHPIATNSLSKGDVIAAAYLERAIGAPRETDAYRLGLRRIIDYVTRRLRDRGEIVTIVERKHSLVILTDAEASEYNAQRFNIELRGAARAHARNLGVDRSKLPDAQLAKHDRALETNGRILHAIRRERALVIGEHKRVTPLPPGAKDD
jgi:hypothetical protein